MKEPKFNSKSCEQLLANAMKNRDLEIELESESDDDEDIDAGDMWWR